MRRWIHFFDSIYLDQSNFFFRIFWIRTLLYSWFGDLVLFSKLRAIWYQIEFTRPCLGAIVLNVNTSDSRRARVSDAIVFSINEMSKCFCYSISTLIYSEIIFLCEWQSHRKRIHYDTHFRDTPGGKNNGGGGNNFKTRRKENKKI